MMRSSNRWLLMCAAAFLWIGCSGDQEEAEDVVEAAAEEGEEAAGDAEEAVEDAAPTAEEEAEAAKPATPAPAAEPPGFTGKPAVRYVTSFALNVRSGPSKDAPVLKHVKWGDKVSVVINGEWAKLAAGEYISSKHLAASPPGSGAPKAKKAATKKKAP